MHVDMWTCFSRSQLKGHPLHLHPRWTRMDFISSLYAKQKAVSLVPLRGCFTSLPVAFALKNKQTCKSVFKQFHILKNVQYIQDPVSALKLFLYQLVSEHHVG